MHTPFPPHPFSGLPRQKETVKMINVFFVLYKTQLRKLKTFPETVRSLSVRVAMVTTSAKGSKSLQNPRLCPCIKKTFFFFRGIYYHLTRTRCGIGRLDPSESRIVDVKSDNKQSISARNEESISNENQSFIACREKSICNEMIPLSEDED